MERIFTWNYTNSSTSESQSWSSDDNIEESTNSHMESMVSLEFAISYLIKNHYFACIDKKSSKKFVFAFFSDNLNALNIMRDNKTLKKIFTPDIMNISTGPAINFKKTSETFYPIYLKTRKKNYFLCCNNLFERDKWYSCVYLLLKFAKDCFSPLGLKNYINSLINFRKSNKKLSEAKNAPNPKFSTRNGRKEKKVLENEIILILLSDIITKVEEKSLRRDINSLLKQAGGIVSNKFLTNLSQADLEKLNRQKDQEIRQLSDAYKSINFHISTLNAYYNFFDPWKTIMTFLTFSEIFSLKSVSKVFRRKVHFYLRKKANWKVLARKPLYPQKVSWRFYMNCFYEMQISAMGQEVKPEIIEDIKKDVIRGVPAHFEETEDILIGLCALIPNVGYCQGMQQVVYFLLENFRDSSEVLGTLVNLLRPPFYLGDLWKIGFDRLKLGIFQIKIFLKLKLPFLAQHFKNIDFRLDIIATPWLLTVFTCFISKTNSMNAIRDIWDLFLICGWNALISTCLAIFHRIQGRVLGKSLEKTLESFSFFVDFKDLKKDILKFEVSETYLDQLERAFYLKKDYYE